MVNPRQITCFGLFEAEGYPPEAAAAWVGNLSQESGAGLPSAFRTGQLDHGSQYLPQWRLERLTKYESWVRSQHPEEDAAGLRAWCGNMALQVKYIAIECKRDYSALDIQLRRGGDIDTLTDAICWQFERPNKALSGIANRKAQAHAVFLAAPHMNPHGETTKGNVVVIKGKENIKRNNENAAGGIIMGGVVAALHYLGGMPDHMALAAGGVVVFVIVYSMWSAQQTSQKTLQASIDLHKMATPVTVPTDTPPMSRPTPYGHWTWVEDPPPPPPPTPLMTSDIGMIAEAVAKLLDEKIAAELKGVRL
jgi:hypothetical protein